MGVVVFAPLVHICTAMRMCTAVFAPLLRMCSLRLTGCRARTPLPSGSNRCWLAAFMQL